MMQASRKRKGEKGRTFNFHDGKPSLQNLNAMFTHRRKL
jgi:hypothetical protein